MGSGGFWGKGSAAAVRINWLFLSGTPISLCRLGRKNRFKGVLLALGLYMALLLRLVQNATREKTALECFGDGSCSSVGFPRFVNVAMVIGAMPDCIPLPLMSYGGSATLFVFMAMAWDECPAAPSVKPSTIGVQIDAS